MLGKHTLSPKEKTELRIVFDTRGNPGPFRKTAMLSVDTLGQEETEVEMTGTVTEAPGAKIQISPRKVVLSAGGPAEKRQEFTIANKGALPLVIVRIYAKGSDTVYFDGKKEGNIIVQPGSTTKVEIDLSTGRKENPPAQQVIAVESNAKNAPSTGYVLFVQYSTLPQ